MITTTAEPSPVHLLPRGNWLDESGPLVTPALPTFLDQLNLPTRRATRRDLAEWFTSKRNPLTARVMVNRLWGLLFGRGICRSVEDFGAQGVAPTHPELLDWLASEYIDSGWDTKHLIKQIVMSAAYRQSSVPSTELVKTDPTNQLFGRQGRSRLDAEFIRDNALAVSGLLVHKLGGTSAKPYQPPHYWDYLNFPTRTWEADKGDNQHRRGLYTYWCRTYLQPSLLAFDAPTREECCSARVVSNTPQQALALLNDPTYVEAAQGLAERVLAMGAKSHLEHLRDVYHLALQRDPTPQETNILTKVYRNALQETRTAYASRLKTVGYHKQKAQLNPKELVAWTSVARVVINLHEFITRN